MPARRSFVFQRRSIYPDLSQQHRTEIQIYVCFHRDVYRQRKKVCNLVCFVVVTVTEKPLNAASLGENVCM